MSAVSLTNTREALQLGRRIAVSQEPNLWTIALAELEAAEQVIQAARELYACAHDEVAEKSVTPKAHRGGADYWASSPDHPIPGVQRRINIARAVVKTRDALARFDAAHKEET